MQKNKKGFTLVELLAAVVILGMLLTIGVVSISRIIKSSKEKTALASAHNVIDSASGESIMNGKESGGVYPVDKFASISGVKNGELMFDNDGSVSLACLYVNGKSVIYQNKSYKIHENDSYCDRTDAVAQLVDEKDNAAFAAYIESEKSSANTSVIPDKTINNSFFLLGSTFDDSSVSKNEGVAPVAHASILTNFSRYDLRDDNALPEAKQSDNKYLSWSYSINSSIESNILNKRNGMSGEAFNLSEKQLDYLTAYDGFYKGMRQGNVKNYYNPFAGYEYIGINSRDSVVNAVRNNLGIRMVGEGSSNKSIIRGLFSGLTLHDEEKYNSSASINYDIKGLANSEIVAETKYMDYYVKELEELSYSKPDGEEYTEKEISDIVYDIKKYIGTHGAVTSTVCMAGYTVVNNKEKEMTALTVKSTPNDKYSKVNHVLVRDISPSDCTWVQSVAIIGWDNDIKYYDNNKKIHQGAWIVQNSWDPSNDKTALFKAGGVNKELYQKYFYVAYDIDTDYQYRYFTHLSVKDTEKYDNSWDKSYSSLQTNDELYDPSYSRKYPNIYFNKVDGEQEILKKIGFYTPTRIRRVDDVVYILSVANKSECSSDVNMYDNIRKVSDSVYEYNGKQYNGTSIDVGKQKFSGFKVYDIPMFFTEYVQGQEQAPMTFDKDYCVVLPSKNGEATLYTSHVTKPKTYADRKYDSYLKVKTDNYFVIETASNGVGLIPYNDPTISESGLEFKIDIYDKDNKVVNDEFIIENGEMVNNITETVIRYKDPQEMHNNTYYVKLSAPYYVEANNQIIEVSGTNTANTKNKKQLCSISLEDSVITTDRETLLFVKCYNTGSDTYYEDKLKDFVSIESTDDETVKIVRSYFTKADDFNTYVYAIKGVKSGYARFTVRNIQTTTDENYYNAELISDTLTVSDKEPICSVTGSDVTIHSPSTVRTSIMLTCSSSVGLKLPEGTYDENGRVNPQAIKVLEEQVLHAFTPPNGSERPYEKDGLNDSYEIESVSYLPYEIPASRNNPNLYSATFEITSIHGIKPGTDYFTIPRGIVYDLNGVTNDVSKAKFLVKVDAPNSKVSCSWQSKGWLFAAKLKKGNSTSLGLSCSSTLPFGDISEVISVDGKNVSVDGISNVRYSDPRGTNDYYSISEDVEITGRKVGFTDLTLKENSVKDIAGVGNTSTTSNTIWVRLLLN